MDLKKGLFGGALIGAMMCTNAQAGTVNWSGELDITISSTSGSAPFFVANGIVEVDTFNFSVGTAGIVTIDSLSWLFAETYFDPMMYLFNDDGNPLGAGNFIAANDDSFSDTNGSISIRDSYISLNLAAGDYTIAMGAFFLTLTDISNGFNSSRVYGQTGTPASGAYQVDIIGDDVYVAVVPLPPAAIAGLGMLAGLGAYRRIRK